MKSDNKIGATFWLRPETVQRMDNKLTEDNCKSRSEFAEKALRFYLGYLESGDATGYMSEVLSTLITGILDNNNNRLRSLLFKWAVELNMMCHTIAAHYRVDEIDRRELRAFAVDEVKKTYGQISFDHAIDVQRGLPYEEPWQD